MIAAELGGGGGAEPAVTDLAHRGLRQCLSHAGVLSDDPIAGPAPRHIEITAALHSVYAPADGLFDRACYAGQEAQQGQTVGHLHFPAEPDRPSLLLTFPQDGFVLAHGARGLVRRGDLLALVAQDSSEGH